MRKLRDDITLKEAITWTEGLKDCVGSGGTLWALAQRLGTCRERNASKTPYPDSFYEDPPQGSFGKFFDTEAYEEWGYLEEVVRDRDDCTPGCPYHERGGPWHAHFEPGFPADVDENGWPK